MLEGREQVELLGYGWFDVQVAEVEGFELAEGG